MKRNRSKKDSRKSRCPSRRKRGEIHPELTLMVMSRRREDETREYHLVLYLQGNTFVARQRNRLLTFLYLCLGIFFPPFRDILVTPLNVLKKMREIEEIEEKKRRLSLEICSKGRIEWFSLFSYWLFYKRFFDEDDHLFLPLIVRGVRKEILVGNFGLREIIERGGNTKWNTCTRNLEGRVAGS